MHRLPIWFTISAVLFFIKIHPNHENIMLDIQLLRNDAAAVAARLAGRGYEHDTAAFEAPEPR